MKSMKSAVTRSMLKIMAPLMAMTMASGGDSCLYPSYEPHEPTRSKSKEEIPGYEHDGMYSQTKKLRPGAGKKKLTRAQRKKLAQYNTKKGGKR